MYAVVVRSTSPSTAGTAPLLCGLQHLYTQLHTRADELNALLSPNRSVSVVPPRSIVSATGALDSKARRHSKSDDSKSLHRSRSLSSAGGSPRLGKGWKVVSGLIGVLTGLCRQPSAAEQATEQPGTLSVRELAAKCLGEIGAVDPQLLNRNCYLSQVVAATMNAAAALSGAPTSGNPSTPTNAGGANFNLFDPASSPAPISQIMISPLLRRLSSGLKSSAAAEAAAAAPRTSAEFDYVNAHHHRRHHIWLLYALNSYLSHPQATVMVGAADTLKRIFHAPPPVPTAASSGGAGSETDIDRAFDALDPTVQQYLLPYNRRAAVRGAIPVKRDSQLHAAERPKSRERFVEREETVEIRDELEANWALPTNTSGVRGSAAQFDVWISELTHSLLRHKIGDEVLKACAGMCLQLPNFAAKYVSTPRATGTVNHVLTCCVVVLQGVSFHIV